MWKTEKFIVANGFTQFNDPQLAEDLNPYEYFDGDLGQNMDIEFSDAKGSSKKTKKSKEGTFEKVLSYTPIGWAKKGVDALTSPEAIKRREKRRADKMALKRDELQIQKDIANQSLKSGEQDTNLLNKLMINDDSNKSSSKSSHNIIWWIGGALAVGIVGFIIYKKYKK